VARQVAQANQKKEAERFDNGDDVTVSAASATTVIFAKGPQTPIGYTTTVDIGQRSAIQFSGGYDANDFGTTFN